MSTKEELTMRYTKAQQSWEYAKQKELDAIRALNEARADRSRAKERMDAAFLAKEDHIAKTEIAKIGY